jgi:hypothetical protein
VAVGVPEITQVLESMVNPSGSAPPAVTAQLLIADPLLLIVGVIERASFNVPVTELGEKLIVGAAAFTVIVTTAFVVPPPFVAETV